MSRDTSSLRKAEIASHGASLVAVATTLLALSTGMADEANPVSAWLIAVAGVEEYVLLTPLAVAAIFAILRHDYTAGSIDAALRRAGEVPPVPRLRRSHLGWTVAGVLVMDSVGNVLATLWVGVPPMAPGLASEIATTTAFAAGIAVLCLCRRQLIQLFVNLDRNTIRRGTIVATAILLVVAPIAGIVPVPGGVEHSPVGLVSAATGTVIEDFDNGSTGSETTLAAHIVDDSRSYSGDYAAKTESGQGSSQTKPDQSFTNISAWFNMQTVSGTEVLRLTLEDSAPDVISNVRVSSGNVETFDGSSWSGTGISVSADTWYKIAFVNIDSGSQTYDLYVIDESGSTVGKSLNENFQQSAGSPDALEFDSNGNNEWWFDEIAVDQKLTDEFSGNATVRVINSKSGQPVRNARVEAWGVEYDKFSSSLSEVEKDERAVNITERASDLTPPQWTEQDTSDGLPFDFSDAPATTYVAAYSYDNLNFKAGTLDSADLSEPQVTIPEGKWTYLTVWDGGEEGVLPETGYSSQLFGRLQSNASVEIVKLGPGGETARRWEVDIDKEFDSGSDLLSNPLGDNRLPYAKVMLSEGYYRVRPAEDSTFAYTIKVGNPREQIIADLKNETENATSAQVGAARENSDRLNNGTFTRQTFYTNESGYVTVDFNDKSLKTVALQARKLDGLDMQSFDSGRNLTEQERNLTSYIRENRTSVYAPSEVKEVTLPRDETVTLQTRKLSWPRYGNATQFGDVWDQWRIDQLGDPQSTVNGTLAEEWANLRNGTLSESDIQNLTQGRLNRSQIEGLYNEYINLTQNNDRLRNKYQDILRQYENAKANGTLGELDSPNLTEARDTDINTSIDPETATNETLVNRIGALEQAVQQYRSDVNVTTETDRHLNNNTVTAVFEVPVDVSKDDVTVIARTGVAATPVPDRYVGVYPSSIISGNTVIKVHEYPVNGTDPSQVTFAVRATGSGDSGVLPDLPDLPGGGNDTDAPDTPVEGNTTIIKETVTVKNPTVDAEVPTFQSIALDSGYPAPQEQASFRVVSGPEGTVGDVVAADVYYPNGTVAPATVDGKNIQFTAGNAGVHIVKTTLQPVGSDQNFTETVRIRAAAARSQPAMVRAATGQTGDYTVVANGLSRAQVNTGGNTVEITAYASEDNTPTDVHLWTSSMSLPPDADIKVNLLKSDGQTYDANARVHIHTEALASDAIVYREANDELDALPRQAANENGRVRERNGQLVITTATGPAGTVTIRTNNDPGIVDRTVYELRLSGVPIPSLGIGMTGVGPLVPQNPLGGLAGALAGLGPGLVGALLVGRRRRG